MIQATSFYCTLKINAFHQHQGKTLHDKRLLLIEGSDDDQHFFINKVLFVFLKRIYTIHCFQNIMLNRLCYSADITLICSGGKCMTQVTVISALLWWSGTEPTVSPRYACVTKLWSQSQHSLHSRIYYITVSSWLGIDQIRFCLGNPWLIFLYN